MLVAFFIGLTVVGVAVVVVVVVAGGVVLICSYVVSKIMHIHILRDDIQYDIVIMFVLFRQIEAKEWEEHGNPKPHTNFVSSNFKNDDIIRVTRRLDSAMISSQILTREHLPTFM